jgi:AcrR family transcriptional regulator
MRTSENNVINSSFEEVRERLLDVGERLFCEKGYKGTSIRDLTGQANCNIAAVNYHFGGKKKLYSEIFHRQFAILRDVRIEAINGTMAMAGENITLEKLLRSFAEAFIEPLAAQSSGRCFMKLMMREMLDPHLSVDIFMSETVIPVVSCLRDALKKIYPTLNDEKAIFCIRSLVAQLIHTIQLQELFKEANTSFLGIDYEQSVEHIIAFSAAGIRSYVKEDG